MNPGKPTRTKQASGSPSEARRETQEKRSRNAGGGRRTLLSDLWGHVRDEGGAGVGGGPRVVCVCTCVCIYDMCVYVHVK